MSDAGRFVAKQPKMQRWSIFLFLLLAAATVAGQTLTLEQAVERAIDQSLEAQQAQLDVASAKANYRQSKLDQYPNAAFSTNAGFQFGLGVDPTTNTLQQQQIFFASPSINANATLFAGGRIRSTIARNKVRIEAAEASAEDLRQDVALNMANQYLSALLAREELNAARSRLVDAQAQLQRTDRLIEAGSLARVERFPLASEQARAQQNVVVAQNALELAELQLKQLLRMEPAEALQLVRPESIDFDKVQLSTAAALEVYQAAVSRQPAIRAAELNEAAATEGLAIAKAGYYPNLTAFGQLNSRYSSQATELVGFTMGDVEEQTVFIDGNPITLGFPSQNPEFQTISAGQQLNDFFGQVVGINLNVPIFSNGVNDLLVQQAQLDLERARLSTALERQRLEVEVSQALQAARAAQAEVAASERALEAARATVSAAQRRSEAGAASAYELANAQLLLEQAEVTYLRNRYQFLFNAKVVDFYLGRPLTLD